MIANNVGFLVEMVTKDKPTVYYGCTFGSEFSAHLEINDLLPDFKKKFPYKEEDFFKCPSFISWTKDKLVINAPADFEITRGAEDDNSIYAQWCVGQFFFFSDSEVKLTTYPPFMERNDIQGVVGEMDISSWVRPVNPCSVIPPSGKLEIKQGQGMLYVGFDRPVKLERVLFPPDINVVGQASMVYKRWGMKNRTLDKLYKNFTKSKYSRVILKKVKDFNNL